MATWEMRIANVGASREKFVGSVQSFTAEDISDRIVQPAGISLSEPFRRVIGRLFSEQLLRALQPVIVRHVHTVLPFRYDCMAVGERLSSDASRQALLRRLRRDTIRRVLVPGCYTGGEDVQWWLRHGVAELEGIDVYSLDKIWAKQVPRLQRTYGAKVRFQQASIERLPFADAAFDLVASSAVLEHVRNIDAMVDETARVLRVGGWAWHEFGPLYYSWGGDHCSASFGDEAGYDHLLLDDAAYQARLLDVEHFDRQPDPNAPFWALRDQFSFLRAKDYLESFSRRFSIEHTVVVINERALLFRERYPDRWNMLLGAGVKEADLLVKTLRVVLRRQ